MSRDYQRLKQQDAADSIRMAYVISSSLHNCTQTEKCKDPTFCLLCSNASRLAVQHYRSIIEKRTLNTFVEYFDAGCTMNHPGGD